MKAVAALLAMTVTVLALLVITMVELLAKLAPLLIVGVVAWAAVMACRARQRRPVPATGGVRTGVIDVAAGPQYALPPRMQHQERVYVIRGEETGLSTLRPDGYLKVSADQLPPPRQLTTPRPHTVSRSGNRRRPSAPKKTRP
uniref:Uncharacterized protein n=1 Tax=Mycobacterium riyadhense TaxID=486698 RepID=A0A653F4E5_9MYCO|nr:hypothetical protein BIN_B_05284 [Mycobacterium riyadhense]